MSKKKQNRPAQPKNRIFTYAMAGQAMQLDHAYLDRDFVIALRACGIDDNGAMRRMEHKADLVIDRFDRS